MTESYDVLVVGAGIIGAAVAAEVAQEASVLLVEAEAELAVHSTGRSAAMLIQLYGGPEIQELTAISRRLIEGELTERAGQILRPRQVLWAGNLGDPLHDQLRELSLGVHAPRFEWMSAEDASLLHPALDPALFELACLEPDAARIEVDVLHRALLRLAVERGALIRRRTPLLAARRTSTAWRCALPEGEVEAGLLVNAAGAWGDHIAALAGVAPLGLRPRKRTVMVATCNLDATPELPFVADLADDLYFEATGSQFLISPADEQPAEPGHVRAHDLDIAIAAERLAERSLLRVERVVSSWAGLRTFAPDRLPVLGRDMSEPGFVWAAGVGGFGIMTAPAMAHIVAESIWEKEPSPLAERLTSQRFSTRGTRHTEGR